MNPSTEPPAPLRIALLDSGLHVGHPHIAGDLPPGSRVVGATLELRQVGTAWEHVGLVDGQFADGAGHGTACAAALLQALGHDARGEPSPAGPVLLDALRVFGPGPDLLASPRLLIEGIRQAVQRGARLLCLPLGLRDRAWVEPVRQAVDEASQAGALVCAACHASGQWSLPAALPGVVAVAADRAQHFPALRLHPGPPVERIIADGHARAAPTARNFFGTSVACARVAGTLARLALERPDLSWPALLEGLKAQARSASGSAAGS